MKEEKPGQARDSASKISTASSRPRPEPPTSSRDIDAAEAERPGLADHVGREMVLAVSHSSALGATRSAAKASAMSLDGALILVELELAGGRIDGGVHGVLPDVFWLCAAVQSRPMMRPRNRAFASSGCAASVGGDASVATVFDELLATFRDFLRSVRPRAGARLRRRDRLDHAGAHARAQRPCPACAHLPRASPRSPATARKPLAELLARTRRAFHWGQTYTAADFGQTLHRQLRLAGGVRHARPFRQRHGRRRLSDPRPGHRLSRPSSCRRGDLHSADRRHGVAHGRRAVPPARGRRGHPPCVQRQPRHAHRQASRCWRSISGAAGRWPQRSTVTGAVPAGRALSHGQGDHAAGHRLGCRQDGAGRRACAGRPGIAA